MLSDYPIYFDDVKLFTPESWEESYSVVESTNQTEAGTDQVIVTRYDKLFVSAFFPCSSRWAARFAEFRDKDSIQVKLYDLKTQGYKTRTIADAELQDRTGKRIQRRREKQMGSIP